MNANPKRKSRQGNRVRAERGRRQHQEEALDDALRNTFPASDPISIEQPVPPARIATEDVHLETNIGRRSIHHGRFRVKSNFAAEKGLNFDTILHFARDQRDGRCSDRVGIEQPSARLLRKRTSVSPRCSMMRAKSCSHRVAPARRHGPTVGLVDASELKIPMSRIDDP